MNAERKYAAMAAAVAVIAGGCADYAPSASTAQGAPAATATPRSEDVFRGFYSPLTFWDQAFTPTTPADCIAMGAEAHEGNDLLAKRNISYAWRLPSGGLACSAEPGPRSGGRVYPVDLYFNPDIDAQAVLSVVGGLAPADSAHVASLHGVNGANSKWPRGTCQVEVFTSDTLSAAILQDNPEATGVDDPHRFTVQLASGVVEPGGFADRPFDSGAVHVATIMSGDDPPGADGTVKC